MLKQPQIRLNSIAAAIALVGGVAGMSNAFAAAPAAGTSISNIATASYTDPSGKKQDATSNEVKTTVVQVASFTLVDNRTAFSNPNQSVKLSHTLTNTGNGADQFLINVSDVVAADPTVNGVNSTDSRNFASFQVFLDDGNGNPVGPNLQGTKISLPAGDQAKLIIVAQTPLNAVNADTIKLTINATSTVDATQTIGNRDTVTVTGDAVIVVDKAVSVGVVNPMGTEAQRTIEYTLKYKNTGNTTATNLVLKDMIPANTTYKADSAVWSNSGTGLTDIGTDGDGYDFNVTNAGAVTFTIPSVAPNVEGTLKFKIVVNATAPADQNVDNTAKFTYVPAPGVPTTPENSSNTVTTDVLDIYAGAINDNSGNNYNDAERDANDPAKDDLQSVVVQQASTATFTVYAYNRGNSTETFDLTANTTPGLVGSTNLPAGSIVQFFKADGVTPLTSTGGSTAVDTGPLAAGASVAIVVKVTLPSTYQGVLGSTTDNLDTVITLDPVNGATNDTTTLRISDVTAAKVDLTNDAVTSYVDATTQAADGEGPYDSNVIVDSLPTEAGVPVTFPLEVYNGGTNPDNFNITPTVPQGWTVVVYTADANGVCSNTPVSNTGNILAGQTAHFCAVVTPPADAAPSASPVLFNVKSQSTGAEDTIKDEVVVDDNRSLTFSPDRTGQVVPDGTIVYSHTLTNTGNATEGDQAGELPVTITGTTAGFNVSVYVDLDNDGVADDNELLTNGDLNSLLPGGLAPDQSVNILVKVKAPANATDGLVDTSTITVTPTGNNGGNSDAAPAALSVTDKTTVTTSVLRLEKFQALDDDCAGSNPVGAFTKNSIDAKPGACVVYRIVATNEGSLPLTNVLINDSVPAYTTLVAGSASNDGTLGNVTAPGPSVQNSLVSPPVSLPAGGVAVLKFTVKVDQ